MKYLNSFWNWLDGKKTVVGAIASLVTAYSISKGWIGDSEQVLFLGLSALLVGTGVIHKISKVITKKEIAK